MEFDLKVVLEAISEQFGGGGSWETTLRLTPGQSDAERSAAHRRVASLIRSLERRGYVERPGSLWRVTSADQQWLAARSAA